MFPRSPPRAQGIAAACRQRFLSRLVVSASALLATLVLLVPGVRAQAFDSETWVGAEAFRRAWSLYTGVTVAPSGAILEDGLRLRLRAVAGQGQYRTTGGGTGVSPFADALVGYQMHAGPLTLKTFGGLTALAEIESRQDLAQVWSRTRLGPKAALEAWWTLGERAWISLDLSWGEPRQVTYGRVRTALRAAPNISTGLEGIILGTASASALRGGPFVRYEWSGGEVSVSGGIATDGAPGWAGTRTLQRDPGGYLTLVWLRRF